MYTERFVSDNTVIWTLMLSLDLFLNHRDQTISEQSSIELPSFSAILQANVFCLVYMFKLDWAYGVCTCGSSARTQSMAHMSTPTPCILALNNSGEPRHLVSVDCRAAESFTQTKIRQLQQPILIQQQVIGFQIVHSVYWHKHLWEGVYCMTVCGACTPGPVESSLWSLWCWLESAPEWYL